MGYEPRLSGFRLHLLIAVVEDRGVSCCSLLDFVSLLEAGHVSSGSWSHR